MAVLCVLCALCGEKWLFSVVLLVLHKGVQIVQNGGGQLKIENGKWKIIKPGIFTTEGTEVKTGVSECLRLKRIHLLTHVLPSCFSSVFICDICGEKGSTFVYFRVFRGRNGCSLCALNSCKT